jgi:hypothetical protein
MALVALAAIGGLFAKSAFAGPFDGTPFQGSVADPSTWDDAGRAIDRARREQIDPHPIAGRDYMKVFVKNSTSSTVHVAIEYMPLSIPGESQLAALDGSGGWSLKYWYTLRPGERTHLASTDNRYFYLFAESTGGETWGGIHSPTMRSYSFWLSAEPYLPR